LLYLFLSRLSLLSVYVFLLSLFLLFILSTYYLKTNRYIHQDIWPLPSHLKSVLRNRAILPRFRFRFRVPNFSSTVPAPVLVPTLKF
jgi:hypothetical protein